MTESQRRKCHERWQKRSRVVTFKGTGDGNWVVLLPHHMWLHLHWGHNKKYWNDQFQVFTGEGMILRRQLTIDCSENLSLSGVGFKDFLWLWPESLLLTSPPLVQKLLRNIWHRWNHSPILAVLHSPWLEWLAAVMISVTSDCLPPPGELGHSCSGRRRWSEAERRSLSHLSPPSTSHTTTSCLTDLDRSAGLVLRGLGPVWRLCSAVQPI